MRSLFLSSCLVVLSPLIAAPAFAQIGVDDGPDYQLQTTPGSRTLLINGKAANQPNGTVKLVFTVYENDDVLFSETRSVTISAEKFSLRLGAGTLTGIPAAVFAGTTAAEVRWRLENSSTVLGTLQLGAVPYAMTLAPNAQVKSTSVAPALTVSNTSVALKGVATSSTGRGVVGESTSSASASYGVEGRAASASGAAGHFVNPAGDLIVGRNAVDGDVKFRVANNGDVYVRGTKVGQRGPKGDVGATGQKGDTGLTGPPGQQGAGTADVFCLNVTATNCNSACMGGSYLVAATASPCATSMGCQWNGTGAMCCVCTATH